MDKKAPTVQKLLGKSSDESLCYWKTFAVPKHSAQPALLLGMRRQAATSWLLHLLSVRWAQVFKIIARRTPVTAANISSASAPLEADDTSTVVSDMFTGSSVELVLDSSAPIFVLILET